MSYRLLLGFFLSFMSFTQVIAQNTSSSQQPQTPEQRMIEIQAAWNAAAEAGTKGPATVQLGEQASLTIPDGQIYIPPKEAIRFLVAMGNSSRMEPPLGLVTSLDEESNWLVVVRHVKEGYIKDDDARNWNVDDLLKSLKEGTEATNGERRERGIPALIVDGWLEPPAYSSETHRLVWALGMHSADNSDGQNSSVNYNTYALGRDGYFSLNLVSSKQELADNKPRVQELLASLTYKNGKRYEDFNASTDQVAAYGLAALIGGAAAKKLGFLALAGAFLAKFAKIIAVGGLALVAGLISLFRRKKGDEA